MGIGLIALAFIFMYGLKLTINDVNLGSFDDFRTFMYP